MTAPPGRGPGAGAAAAPPGAASRPAPEAPPRSAAASTRAPWPGRTIRAAVFDLDDTLYPEPTFAAGGFDAAARLLADRTALPFDRIRRAIDAALAAAGRGRTFDVALESLGCAPAPSLVAAAVQAYREHRPRLALHSDAARALAALRAAGLRLGVITDGDPGVQRRKAAALGLDAHVDVLVFSWDDGPERQKPDPLPYRRALAALGIEGGEAIYVGDNPRKDFVGARALGLGTARILRGPFAGEPPAPGFHADVELAALDELLPLLGR